MRQPNNRQRALLVALALSAKQVSRWSTEDSLDELENLVHPAGANAIGREVQIRDQPDAATFIGRVK